LGEREGYTTWEFPVKKALKIFALIAIVAWTSSYVATLFFNLDFMLLNIHLQNLWLLIPETVVVFGSVWIWNWSRQSEKKKRAKKTEAYLEKLLTKS